MIPQELWPFPMVLSRFVTSENVWKIIRLIQEKPRLQYALLSLVVSGTTLRYVLWTLYPYLTLQWKIQEKRFRVKEKKRAIRETCADAQDIVEIVEKDGKGLLKKLKKGHLTGVDVLKAFQKKALKVDEEFNAITEPVMEALDQARRLDALPNKDGLLHGMPVSVKECVSIAGYDRTGGMGCLLSERRVENAIVVKVLKEQGAIPFVRTNISQTMLSYCSSNFIYGQTLNPHDGTRGPGGSSSGEGALISGGGSFMGIGTDIGGGIRVPAAFCGCYSLKPTTGRLSNKGELTTDEGPLPIVTCTCPIAIDLKCLVRLCKGLFSDVMYRLDPTIPPLTFNTERFKSSQPMRIGYFVYDGNVRCQPPVVRAVMESKFALEKLGHTMVSVNLTEMSSPGYDPVDMHSRLLIPDRCQKIRQTLGCERWGKGVGFLMILTMIPPWLLRVLSFIVAFKDQHAANVFRAGTGFRSVEEYLEDVAKLKKWREQFTASWHKLNLDAIICPVFPSVAPNLEWTPVAISAGGYCFMFNSLDFPAGVMPVTTVSRADVRHTMNHKLYKPTLWIEHWLMKGVAESHGMPVAIQCVALPYREETCLRVMREVEEALKKIRTSARHYSHAYTRSISTQSHEKTTKSKKDID